MEQWQDQGIVIHARRHGENGAVVTLLTENYGRYSGYVRGATGKTMRGALELGNVVSAKWQSRVSDGLGGYTLELNENPSAHILHDPHKLLAIQAVCALCDAALPDREAHHGLFHGTLALFDAVKNQDIWLISYIYWEISYLKELGFSLDLSKCAGGGDQFDLKYVSPKTGRAVSGDAGEPYKEKLLALASFLAPNHTAEVKIDDEEIKKAFKMTNYFLEHWAFTHHSSGIPAPRLRFGEIFVKTEFSKSII